VIQYWEYFLRVFVSILMRHVSKTVHYSGARYVYMRLFGKLFVVSKRVQVRFDISRKLR